MLKRDKFNFKPGVPMKKVASELVDEILEFLWMENPVEATLAGVHRYDDRLEKLDLVSRRNKLSRKKEYFDQITALQAQRINTPELDLLKAALEVGIRMEEQAASLDRDAATYPRLALYGVYQLVARSNAPYHYRALRAVDRMREIPRILAEGKLNISYGENIPYILTMGAAELTATGREYLSQLISMLIAEVPDLENVVKKYAEHALKAFEDYLEFLIEDIQPRSNGATGVGEDLFDFLLKREHRLSLNLSRLRRIALEEVERAEGELQGQAALLGGSSNWREKISMPDKHKPDSDLLSYWKGIVVEVEQAVKKAKLVTLPTQAGLVITRTPSFERLIIPTAGYIEAPLFEEQSKAFFCVTIPEEGSGEQEMEAALKMHSRVKALLTVVRDVYPGRHTLLDRRRKGGNRLAYLARGNMLEEGWCSYVLGLVTDRELFDDPKFRLLASHDRLLAASRVLIDLDLHTRGLNESQAVNRLAAAAGIPERLAWFQVRSLASSPTSSVGAMVGRIKIESWREACRKKEGKTFSLKKFHDSLLRLCAFPPDMVEKRLLRAFSKRRK